MSKWKEIADEKIIGVWKCDEEGCTQEALIHPDWYQDNGTPMCSECDVDMSYSHTERSTEEEVDNSILDLIMEARGKSPSEPLDGDAAEALAWKIHCIIDEHEGNV